MKTTNSANHWSIDIVLLVKSTNPSTLFLICTLIKTCHV